MGYMPICPVRSNNQDVAQKHQISITQVPLWEISSISSVKKLFKKYKDACAVISCLSSRKGTKKDNLQAYMWIDRAANQGDEKAKKALATLEKILPKEIFDKKK